ncbi:GNAT family N-acetyltransferase [Candidatus Thorarchaeota archaeon]|nr:MAG: GNAT family N-acetyltransferase [Candidatus Thorarchaeota archaeon]
MSCLLIGVYMMKSDLEGNRFAIINNPTNSEIEDFQKGFEGYNMEQTNGEYNSPEDWLSLVLKDHDGNIVGGIQTSTLFWAQYLEVFWVDERYRGLGYGRDLIEEVERLARENGCFASQTYTFSWQGGDFYQAVGYKLIATYDGYVEGITELILSKPLNIPAQSRKSDPARFKISRDDSEESKRVVQRGLGKNFDDNVADLLKMYPHMNIGLVVKNHDGEVIGGLSGYSSLGTMNVKDFWVNERYRNQGYGKDLMVYAERVARERECISLQSACFTFQNLDFMLNFGFEPYGLSDVYPRGEKEYYLIKRLTKD